MKVLMNKSGTYGQGLVITLSIKSHSSSEHGIFMMGDILHFFPPL